MEIGNRILRTINGIRQRNPRAKDPCPNTIFFNSVTPNDDGPAKAHL